MARHSVVYTFTLSRFSLHGLFVAVVRRKDTRMISRTNLICLFTGYSRDSFALEYLRAACVPKIVGDVIASTLASKGAP